MISIPCTTRVEAEEEVKKLRANPSLNAFTIKIVEYPVDLFQFRVECSPPEAVK